MRYDANSARGRLRRVPRERVTDANWRKQYEEVTSVVVYRKQQDTAIQPLYTTIESNLCRQQQVTATSVDSSR
ncbi:hypothetical protein BaRGS_00014428 [Batillaria attramentaria]|uniref:Uncharacterized protein n=1 Tax=Batillaria attramentaria TaxID=370345 RepID=A0ABD0L4P7_9CAEN